MITAAFSQAAFRARADDVALNSTSWTYAKNTNWTQDRDTQFRLRFLVQETAGGTYNNSTWVLQYNRNSTGWADVDSTLLYDSAQFANGALITSGQLDGTGTFLTASAGYDTVATSGNITFPVGSEHLELEWALRFPNTWANNDTVQFRLLLAPTTLLNTYAQTPTITISATAVYQGTGALDGSGDIVATAGPTIAYGAAALDGEGDLVGVSPPVEGAAALAGEGLLGATGDPYVPAVSADAPDAWWRFTETSGTTADDYVGTNDLTITGANLDTTGATQTGSAISFDGTDDKADSGSGLGWTGAHSLTVEAWIKASSWTTASATPESAFLLWIDTSGNLAFQVRDSADTTWAVASTTAPSTGAWHHVVGVWDRTAQRALLYVNGSLANQSAVQSFTDIGELSEIVQVGTDGGTVFTAFELDELAIYNEALSSTRISAHYTAGSALSTVSGAAALAGEGAITGAGLVEAFGASALDGSADLAASGLATGFGTGALDGSGDVAATGLAEALAQGALDGEGTLDGAGLATALGASAPSGDGVISATGTTESLAAADLAGEGDLAGNASATLVGEAAFSGEGTLAGSGVTESYGASALLGEGTITADGDGIAVGVSDLDGSGDIAGSAFTESFAAAALDGSGELYANAEAANLGTANLVGEGTFVADGEATAIAAGDLAGEGSIASTGTTESFGAADLDGAGDLSGTSTDIKLGEADLLGEGALAGSGLTISYAEAAATGEGQVTAESVVTGFGGSALDGSASLAASGLAIALGTVVCNGAGVTYSSDEVTYDTAQVTYGGVGCRYIYGEGRIAASAILPQGNAAHMLGQGDIVASGLGNVPASASFVGEGRLSIVLTGEPGACGIAQEDGDSLIYEDGFLVLSEVPGCSSGESALDGLGTVAGSGLTTALGESALDGEGTVVAGGLATSIGEGALVGQGDIVAAPAGVFLGGADLLGEGVVTSSGEVISTAAADIVGEGRFAAVSLNLPNACGIEQEAGDGLLLEDGYLTLTEVPGCSEGAGAFEGSGTIFGDLRPVFYGQAAVDGAGLLGATAGPTTAIGEVAISGSGEVLADGATSSFGLGDLAGEGVLVGDATFKMLGAADLSGEGVLYGLGFVEGDAAAILTGEGDLSATGMVYKVLGEGALVGEGSFYADGHPRYGPPPWLNLPPYFVAVEVKDGSGTVVFNTVATVGSVETPEWETPVAGGTPTSPSWDEEIG